mmetsp:Transcript_36503/g.117157  ORF Transcript_36503/g.117157 Transcript_36503/m.117157 type:complete len:113 (+) Transcript_36503:1036-1374(+)
MREVKGWSCVVHSASSDKYDGLHGMATSVTASDVSRELRLDSLNASLECAIIAARCPTAPPAPALCGAAMEAEAAAGTLPAWSVGESGFPPTCIGIEADEGAHPVPPLPPSA